MNDESSIERRPDLSEPTIEEWQERGSVAAGSLLREARQQLGHSVDDCASALRSRAAQIEALERGDLDVFGGDVYARGFLRSYARLLDVSEDRVLELHGRSPTFTGPAAPAPIGVQRGVPSWVVGILAVVTVAGVLASVLVLGGRRAPETVAAVDAGLEQRGVGAAEAGGSPEPDALTRPPRTQLDPPVVARPPIDLVLTFEAASWLEVLVDGAPLLLGERSGAVIPAGETLRLTGREEVVLRFGNAGGVRVESSGRELGALGSSGQVLRVAFGPDGLVEGDQ